MCRISQGAVFHAEERPKVRLGIWELITVGRPTRLGYSRQGMVSGINEPNVCRMHGVAAVSIHLLQFLPW